MRRWAAILVAVLVPAMAWADGPAVVASIAPIHSLVAGVMEGVGSPTLLLKGAASPHAYSLKPSDARALAGARLVFMVADSLEAFLEKPLKALAAKATVVRLADDAPGMKLLDFREGGPWEGHDQGHAEEKGHKHEDEGKDPHLWLDPGNAIAATRAIAAALAKADPVHATAYQANAAAQENRLKALDDALKARLAPVAGKPFVVYHDAYQYLEAPYGLKAVGSVTVSPDRKPGAKRLAAIRDRIAGLKAACVFAEPQFDPKLVESLTAGTSARPGVLDPLGAGLEPGPGLYGRMMEKLAAEVVRCLSQP